MVLYNVKETEENPDHGAPIDGDESEVIGNIYENPNLLKLASSESL
jgi:hypothetical protein